MTNESIKEEIEKLCKSLNLPPSQEGELRFFLKEYAKAYALSCIPNKKKAKACGIHCDGDMCCDVKQEDGFNQAISEMRSNVNK